MPAEHDDQPRELPPITLPAPVLHRLPTGEYVRQLRIDELTAIGLPCWGDIPPRYVVVPDDVARALLGAKETPDPEPESSARPDPADVPPGRQNQRARSSPGDSKIKVLAAIKALSDNGRWGLTDQEIAREANVTRSTFSRLRHEDSQVSRMYAYYQERTLGLGPERPRRL
jgi:hypothetical protein